VQGRGQRQPPAIRGRSEPARAPIAATRKACAPSARLHLDDALGHRGAIAAREGALGHLELEQQRIQDVLHVVRERSGFVSLRDFPADGKTARVSRPAVTVHPDASIEDAARRLVERNIRQLVVVDERGFTKGVVSALDLLRALSGLEPRHPARFDADCTSAAAFPDDDASPR